jgi:hypothetical protein
VGFTPIPFPARGFLSYAECVRLVDFLIAILQAHGQTLSRLAALLGEESLVDLLETAGELAQTSENSTKSQDFAKKHECFEPISADALSGYSNPYAELSGAVQELDLSEPLQFHLWTYPPYRQWIESSLSLDQKICKPTENREAGSWLVECAVQEAQAWMRGLPLPPDLSARAERAAEIPWLRFRSEVLKKIGRRPLGPVY